MNIPYGMEVFNRAWSYVYINNEGELSNCFSINQLVGQNIILNNRTETSVNRKFSAIISLLVAYYQ